MKKIYSYIILACIILQISLVSAVPKIEPYVNDFAHLLTPEEITSLNLQVDAIEKNTTYEIAIVTVAGTEGQDRITYANKIGDENGVGKKGQDNGVVVLWSTGDDKGGAIATGRYSESILNDAKVVRIGKASRPYFDNGSYYQAFSFILTQIDSEITGKGIPTNSTLTGSTGTGSGPDLFTIIIICIVVFAFIVIISNIIGSGSGGSGFATGAAVGSILSGSSGGSSSGGFSGGSFGGGSFGGGGGRF
jgi:uncharacterized protein